MVGVEHLLQTLQVDQRTAVVVRLVSPGAERQLFLLVIGTSLRTRPAPTSASTSGAPPSRRGCCKARLRPITRCRNDNERRV